jgi:outer membrane protein TolC
MRIRYSFITFILFAELVGVTGNIIAQDSLSLEEALKTGLSNNFGILIARNDAAVASVNNSLGAAGFLPIVNAAGTRSWTVSNTHIELPGRDTVIIREGSDAHSDNFNPNIQLSWTLFDGFNMFVNKKRLNELEKAGQLNLRITIENTVSQIISSYYQLSQQQKTIDAIHEALALSSMRKDLAESKLAVGADSKLSVLQASIDLNADSARLFDAINVFKQLKYDLNLLLSRDPSVDFNVSRQISINEKLSLEEIMGKAHNENSSLIAARINEDIARLAIQQVYAGMYPRLSFFSGYNYNLSHAQVGNVTMNRSYGYNYGLTASWNLFDGFNKYHNLKRAKLEANSAQIELLQQELEIDAELLKVWNDYQTGLTVTRLEKRNLESARENLSITMEKYRNGMINDIDLRIVQQKYVDAESRLLGAELQAAMAENELSRLSGAFSTYMNQ